MSRNFDLLTQIEIENGTGDLPMRPVFEQPLRPSSDQPMRPVFEQPLRLTPDQAARGKGALLDSSKARTDEIFQLVQRIFLSADGNGPRQVVFCGVDSESGSSSVCARAGRILAANSPLSVCLLDANILSPRLSRIFGTNETMPFPRSEDPLLQQCVKVDENLWLGGSNILADDGRALLSADHLKERIGQLLDVFGYVLIDSPGANVGGDAQVLGQIADAAVLVIEANSTRRLAARKAKEALDSADVRLLGTVLHNRSFPIPETLYKRL
jgi:Mrp family chromosome partitioning ATPase